MESKNRNPEIDAYIARSADFARPIMAHLRDLVHRNCPDVTEDIKWSIPHFEYRGDYLCIMTAYSAYCSFTVYKAALMTDPRLQQNSQLKPAKRFLGAIRSLAELPSDAELDAFVREAMSLNERGIKLPPRPSSGPKAIEMPDYFAERLAADPKARTVFDSRSNSFRKEYLVWITGARTDETRNKRMDEAIQWIGEGKARNWKHEKRS